MRWDDWRTSDNVEDRRDEGGGGGGGGGFGVPGGAGGLGIGAIVVLGLIGWALGIDPRLLIGGANVLTGGGSQYQSPAQPPIRGRTSKPNDQVGQFVAKVLAENEDRWKEIFQQDRQRYESPRLVLFRGSTRAGCGSQALAQMGPFYCPADKKIYLDTSFFGELERRFKGCDAGSRSCQFAQAYVIGHEFGHHIQNLLGVLPKVQTAQRGLDKVEANRLQVKVELQADCFAGVWAYHQQKKRQFLEPGDVEAAMKTAAAIGDDRLQRNAGRAVIPDAFTHGSSEQRVRWFNTGLKSGTVGSCNTFGAAQL